VAFRCGLSDDQKELVDDSFHFGIWRRLSRKRENCVLPDWILSVAKTLYQGPFIHFLPLARI